VNYRCKIGIPYLSTFVTGYNFPESVFIKVFCRVSSPKPDPWLPRIFFFVIEDLLVTPPELTTWLSFMRAGGFSTNTLPVAAAPSSEDILPESSGIITAVIVLGLVSYYLISSFSEGIIFYLIDSYGVFCVSCHASYGACTFSSSSST
jgi:hypothetical protein